MIVTASKIPVPEPIAPTKSAKIVRAPIQSPPSVAAVGITLGIKKYFLLFKSIPHVGFSCSSNEVTLIFEIPNHITDSRATNLCPGLREEGT